MKKITLAVLLVSGALVAGMNQNMSSFSDFDVDGNGKVTQSEFENLQQSKMTANANAGKLMRNAGNAPTFDMVDTNKDGFVDMNEFNIQQQKNMQRQMSQRANNGNGQGMNRGMNQGMRGGNGQRQGMNQGMRGGNGPRQGMNQNMSTFSDFDADGDGKVTQSEFENLQQSKMTANANAGKLMRNAGNVPTFDMVDTNKDGFVDMNEFSIQQQKNMQRNRKF